MKNINISDSEWEVMKILWEKEPRTLKEIAEVLITKWRYTTTRTLVTRLLKKEALRADKSGSNFKYYSNVLESECKKKEVKDLLKKAFDNSVSELIVTLVPKKDLSDEEYDALIKLVDKIDKGE